MNAVRRTSRHDTLKRQFCDIFHVCDADGIPRELPQLSDVKLAMGVVGVGVDKHVQQHCCSQSVHVIERAFFRQRDHEFPCKGHRRHSISTAGIDGGQQRVVNGHR